MKREIPQIEDYAVIGDCRSAALISKTGSLDWLCWPCFDSPSLFASLISPEDGGCWAICPSGPFVSTRTYLPGTNVLRTTFTTESGTIRVTEWMPVADERFTASHLAPSRELIRMVEGVEGEVEVTIRFEPRPNFGATKAKIQDRKKLGLTVDVPGGRLRLQSAVRYRIDASGAQATIQVAQGERFPFSMTMETEAPSVLASLDESLESLARTTRWWRDWSARCTYVGPFQDAVLRSVLTLKLLHFAPSGAILAAVTTSLPEKIGEDKNYDYRYCWLRDASLSIRALCGTGYEPEAEAFVHWMLTATRLTQPKLMVMYDIYGRLAPVEKPLPHLSGYQNSLPVLQGNMARLQVQMDTYGEVICASARLYKGKGKLDREIASTLIKFGKYVCDHWSDPDAGIWEPRGEPELHTHSVLLCWVALDELIHLAEGGEIDRLPLDRFRSTRDEIRTFIETRAWRSEINSYSSVFTSAKMDATLLLMAFHNFHEASSVRLRGTAERVHAELSAYGSLLYRYRENEPDGTLKEPTEGAFGICGFWAVEHLAMGGGSLEQAEMRFRHLLEYGNDVGLFAEETDPETGDALGNFPQAFTHVGLVSAALAIERRREADAGACEQTIALEENEVS